MGVCQADVQSDAHTIGSSTQCVAYLSTSVAASGTTRLVLKVTIEKSNARQSSLFTEVLLIKSLADHNKENYSSQHVITLKL